jgi:uncharacterized phage protein gp47/JayE
MSFKRDSLAVLLDRVYANYTSLFRPFDKTPRQNLLKVFASVDAGMYHQLLGDLDFLSKQIFPDTAEGEYLREHWSGRIAPLYAVSASGEATAAGKAGKPVPAGVVFEAASGERYYLEKTCRLDAGGQALITLKAENPGAGGNLSPGEKLSMVSAIPAGIDSEAVVSDAGISGGVDAESDGEYLVRVLAYLRNPVRYGKTGDFAAWALDATPEVSAAWEFKDYGDAHALLIQVINGNQFTGVRHVGGLKTVSDYIAEVGPPVLFTVQTPEIIALNPVVALPPGEDTLITRETVVTRIKTWLQRSARPGAAVSAEEIKAAIAGGGVSGAAVKLNGGSGILPLSILQYPCIGELVWE